MLGSSVRRIRSDGRASMLPPEKKRSASHVRPLRSWYRIVEPAIMRRLPTAPVVPGTAFTTGEDWITAGTDFSARDLHAIAAPAITMKAAAYATTLGVSPLGRGE